MPRLLQLAPVGLEPQALLDHPLAQMPRLLQLAPVGLELQALLDRPLAQMPRLLHYFHLHH